MGSTQSLINNRTDEKEKNLILQTKNRKIEWHFVVDDGGWNDVHDVFRQCKKIPMQSY